MATASAVLRGLGVKQKEETVSSMHAGTLFVLIVATETFTFHDSRFLKALLCQTRDPSRAERGRGAGISLANL